jgi:ADP-dependent NAD(P)H-hydrate dehydratase / NAD(P)H-hydrate epimerase
MLKILDGAQIKACDDYTILHEAISSIDLMERACQAFVTWFTQRFAITEKIGIICGTGNNGGDGLGIARLLKNWGYPVTVWIVKGDAKETQDFKTNFGRLPDAVDRFEISTTSDQGLFYDRTILVDAIFGSGLSRPAEGIYAQAISWINKTPAVRIAVDVPSGLGIDHHSTGAVVQAHHTISFQLPKLSFLLPENYPFVGEWHLVEIGLSKSFIKSVDTPYFYVKEKDVKNRVKPRSKFDHKGTFGKALLVAGSYGKMGACILSARAALRSGLGLLTIHVPSAGYSIIQAAVPEAMAQVDAHEHVATAVSVEGFDVIGVGPGIGQNPATAKALEKLMASNKPMILDADALNILAGHNKLIRAIPRNSILTPHPGEFERLVGTWADDFERLKKQMELARETKAVIVLKGAHTSIASPEGHVYFNSTGNPGMATGGSGDVLTGILTGLLTQGYSALDTAIIGVYLHGRAGDLASGDLGMASMIASDIIDRVPQAFRRIQS